MSEQERRIILASSSPRRKELLEKIGLKFEVDASNFEERAGATLDPRELVREISQGKARSTATKHPQSLIIAADTIGIIGGKILGKPGGPKEAGEMLTRLSGKSHRVITAFTLLEAGTGRILTESVETRVHFRRLSQEQIERYVSTGEPLDKAGAYAIQGLGAVIVEKIEGDYYNVMGLPLCALAKALKKFDIEVL